MRKWFMAQRWFWNFPRHIKAHRSDWREIRAQVRKVREEVDEVADEVDDHNASLAVIEVMDVMHACETLLVMLVGPDDEYLEKRKMEVIQKNADRGYYDG